MKGEREVKRAREMKSETFVRFPLLRVSVQSPLLRGSGGEG